MDKIKIAFVDGGESYERLTIGLLSDRYEVISTTDNPDLCIYNFYKNPIHKRFRCKKLEISGENIYPHFEEADYSITCHHIDFENRHCRIPFYAFNKEYQLLIKDELNYDDAMFNRQFCSALISNRGIADPFREMFLNALNRARGVASAGGALHNTNYIIPPRPNNAENGDGRYTNPEKIGFIGNFKFNLAMENSSVNGYVTEKITDAFAARTIPIYWGAEDIAEEFNVGSFIRIDEATSFESNLKTILDVCESKESYMKMLSMENKILRKDYLDVYREFLYNVIDGRTFEHSYGNIALV